jgi:hypothetical protein
VNSYTIQACDRIIRLELLELAKPSLRIQFNAVFTNNIKTDTNGISNTKPSTGDTSRCFRKSI